MGTIARVLGTRRRRLMAVSVVVVVAAAAWYVGRSDADGATGTTATAEATVSTVQDTVTGSGTLAARRSSTLTFGSAGSVTKVAVAEGDTVRRGEVLASIDTSALEAALASAQAQLTAAETTAANDGSETSAQQAANAARVDSTTADVAEAQDALDAATLTAPFSGLVASVGYEKGDRVGSSGGGSASGATDAATTSADTSGITVITPRRFVLTADVSASDVERITKGMQAEITPTGATEPVFGTVQSVGRVAQTGTDGTATFPVTIALTGEQEDLYAGTSADVSIIVESRDDVLTVPTAAVTTEGDTTYVTKVADGTATRSEVEIGDTFGMTTEIVSGLSEGDTVRYEQTTRRPGGGSAGQGGMPGGGTGGFPGGGMPGGAAPAMPGGDQ
ncbi:MULTISPECIES: efflux RND transporter periplasmic adaptor subunit [Aeromicrobium]|uniref:efflux RND transporter periplasmic adaptor subunit n=1 Tax=Aeromicrobium TaxID=2040 RepID=UPI00257DA8BE|nr:MULTISPECIES: biotin/lipoyl-binding protein [Aeromicrobium]